MVQALFDNPQQDLISRQFELASFLPAMFKSRDLYCELVGPFDWHVKPACDIGKIDVKNRIDRWRL